jgi:hypothetical protein
MLGMFKLQFNTTTPSIYIRRLARDALLEIPQAIILIMFHSHCDCLSPKIPLANLNG